MVKVIMGLIIKNGVFSGLQGKTEKYQLNS